MSPSSSTLVRIGRITKPHGISGEVAVFFEAGDHALLRGEVVLESPAGERNKVTVKRVRSHHGNLLLTLSGITNRDLAESVRRHSILIPRDKLPPLDDGEVYLLDLPGLTVVVEEENGERVIGAIQQVDIPAGQELWTIITPSGKEILFPAVDEFILGIDLENGTARIAPPPGLLDLYLADKKG